MHTQHIYAVPSLFALIAGPLFGYSFRMFALLCVALVFANGLVFRAAARREGLGPFAAIAVLAVVASMRHPTIGRVVQVTGEAACMGGATVGVILRKPDGTVRANLCDPIHIGQDYSKVVVRAYAAPGELIQPYVSARDPDK